MTVQEFDFSVDVLRALLWQHSKATRLELLLQQKQDWITASHTEFWNDWIPNVFDLRTATEFGLAVWAIILDLRLFFGTGDAVDKPIWGFGAAHQNFNNGNFATTSVGPLASLTIEEKRILLRLRYFQLVTRGAVPEINDFLAYLFADLGLVYVNDGLRMNARYIFTFPLTAAFEAALTAFDLLPRPAAVKVDFIIDGEASGWGFGRYHVTFGQGNFNNE